MDHEVALLKALAEPTRLRLAILLACNGETCVCKLVEALGVPQFRVSRHLGVMRGHGMVEARREGTWMHYRLVPPRSRFEQALRDSLRDCLAEDSRLQRDLGRLTVACCSSATASPATNKEQMMAQTPNRLRVLFLCTGNSCRSQMAEGWTRHLRGDRIDAFSAGIETHGLNPNAVRVMAEAGVDISGHRSKLVGEFAESDLDYVVTVCGHAHETCPLFPGQTKVVHVGFPDPPALAREAEGEDAKLECYRRVRDEICAFVESLPASLGQTKE